MRFVNALCVAVSLLACTSSHSEPPNQWTSVVLSKLCESYGPQFRESKTVAVVADTQPIFDFAALLYVGGVDVTPESARRAQELEGQARKAFIVEPVSVPESACRFERVQKQPRYRDVIQLEMSSPVLNPFDGSTGVFVRSSAGGRPGATWMWIALVRSKTEQWSVSKISVLPTQDG